MIVTKEVFGGMMSLQRVPPESGGILGTSDGVVIDFLTEDMSNRVKTGEILSNTYVPDTIFLNGEIERWHDGGIEFCGIYHTHPPGCRTLSLEDITYAERILCTMPQEKQTLLFPLVFPGEKIKCYRASNRHGSIAISEETIQII